MNQYRQRFADMQLATGVRLRYAEQGDPVAQPIILLHGYTDSWFSYSGVLPALATSYHVYAPDQRGHGDADRPAHGYAMTDFAADVVAFMDALDLPRATVVGHSMGSFIARQVALAAPDRVTRLVLVGSAASPRNPGVLELAQAINGLDDPVPEEFARDFQLSTIYQPVPDDFLNRVVAESMKLPAHVWQMALAGLLAANDTTRLDHIQAPTLVLWGDQDTVFLRADQDALMAGLRNAILKVYPETGHALHWERPAQFVRDLEDFIADGA
jgi:pimeloyl-ACP methyl ester carboxylesterase